MRLFISWRVYAESENKGAHKDEIGVYYSKMQNGKISPAFRWGVFCLSGVYINNHEGTQIGTYILKLQMLRFKYVIHLVCRANAHRTWHIIMPVL